MHFYQRNDSSQDLEDTQEWKTAVRAGWSQPLEKSTGYATCGPQARRNSRGGVELGTRETEGSEK